MAFWFPFLNFMQPGILFPVLQPFKPMLVAALLAGIASWSGDKQVMERRTQCVAHPVFLWLCVFMFVNVISVYYSGISSLIEEFSFWDIYPIFVFVSFLIMKDEAAVRRYVWGLVLGGSVVIGMGIYLWAVKSPLLPGGRAGAYGMYENHNDYTFMILLVMPYAYLMIKTEHSRWLRLVLMAVVAACTLGVLASLSRGGILTLVAEFAMVFWVTTRGGKRIFGLVAIGLLGSAVIVHQFVAREENQAGNYSAEDAKNSRYELWRAAEAMIKKHPLLGVGSRRFHEYSQDYAEISHDNRGKVAHNTFLEVAADTGVLGFGSFMAMMVALVQTLRAPVQPHETDFMRAIKRATVITVVGILFRSSLDAKVHDWSFYTLAAIGIAITVLARRQLPGAAAAQPVSAADTPAPASRAAAAGARPSVYGRYH